MLDDHRELWAAFGACLAIALGYGLAAVWLGEAPASRGLIGHGIGIAGFILMLMTESLYSIRKRSSRARWGRMSSWLKFHIFTGLVGPFMVFLHAAWKYNGLAGVTLLFTGIIVLSGFIGRYIYTSVPRTADGFVIETGEVRRRIQSIANARRMLSIWHTIHVPIGVVLFTAAFIHIVAAIYYATLLR